MATKHSAAIAAGATTSEITVTPLIPHGINTELPAQVLCKNRAGGDDTWCELKKTRAREAAVIYPTSDKLKIENLDSGATNDVHLIDNT